MTRRKRQSMRMEELIKMPRAELPDLDEWDLWPRVDDCIWEILGVIYGFIWFSFVR
jgi:hypothetical protein